MKCQWKMANGKKCTKAGKCRMTKLVEVEGRESRAEFITVCSSHRASAKKAGWSDA